MRSARNMGRLLLSFGAFCVLAGCDSTPRKHFVHWVTRDAWEPGCAAQAAVEKIVVTNARWQDKGKVYVLDVDATYKLINPCDQGADGKSYRQFESVDFKRSNIEMVPCKKNNEDGWALRGFAETRCWTGPNPPRYTAKTIKKKRQTPKPSGDPATAN